ncbi:MAG: DUF3127 domain-containing protein [Bacteroidales bacterium]
METKGKIVHLLPLQSGTSQSGKEWKKQEFIVETQEQYPKKICMHLFGDRVDQYPVAEGDDITVNFDVESREYNGRWYTNVNVWKLEKGISMASDTYAAPSPTFEPQSETDDLPF